MICKKRPPRETSFVLDISAEEAEGTCTFTALVHRELNAPINFVIGLGADVKH